MALTTFIELRGNLQLKCPGLPLPILETAINNSYRRALDLFRWSGARAESEGIGAAPYTTGTVSVTQTGTTIIGSGTTWTSLMTGRQFLVGGRAPYYTFTYVSATSGTLDRIYGGPTASGLSYSIQPIYLGFPADFLSFVTVRDISQAINLNTEMPTEWLDAVDPERTSEGEPTHLVAATLSSNAARWEIWPRPEAAFTLSMRYLKRPADLAANNDVPIFPIRGSGLLEGALAEISLWPGTAERPNPYFRPDLHEVHESRFLEALKLYQREDQEIAQTDITIADGGEGHLSSGWAQEHAVTL